MRHEKHREYPKHDEFLNQLIQSGHGEEAVQAYIHHPNGAFPHVFNALAKSVDGQGIDRMYGNATRILAQLIRDGEVRDGEHLHRIAVGILKCLGRHHQCLTWHRTHPLRPVAASDATVGEARRVPLFAHGVDAADVAVTTFEPADYARRNELLAAVLRAARAIGLLHMRAFSAYRRYEFEFGKTHGAYVYLARLAVLDECCRVVKLRSWRVTPNRTTRPDERVIRQVRAIHLRACDRVREAARRLGYDLPPGV
ncbi:MAG TPA: hypothetical protein VH092_14050 [Urbifossiella sp.]|jgi:hypothetical protein|nr:hypothetical protein [Urbifossiella sp.]